MPELTTIILFIGSLNLKGHFIRPVRIEYAQFSTDIDTVHLLNGMSKQVLKMHISSAHIGIVLLNVIVYRLKYLLVIPLRNENLTYLFRKMSEIIAGFNHSYKILTQVSIHRLRVMYRYRKH